MVTRLLHCECGFEASAEDLEQLAAEIRRRFVESGQPFVVEDSDGNVVERNNGSVRGSFLFAPWGTTSRAASGSPTSTSARPAATPASTSIPATTPSS